MSSVLEVAYLNLSAYPTGRSSLYCWRRFPTEDGTCIPSVCCLHRRSTDAFDMPWLDSDGFTVHKSGSYSYLKLHQVEDELTNSASNPLCAFSHQHLLY